MKILHFILFFVFFISLKTGLPQQFTDINAGLIAVNFSSAVWGDYDNDWDLDILIMGNTGPTIISKIYNNNNGTFTDINAGLTGVVNSSAAWGDYDNDGDLDILITGLILPSGRISKIYNNNNGTFTDINAGLTGVRYGSVAWGDYDNDGDLDILITGEYSNSVYISKIYNNNNETFTDINAGLTGVRWGSVAWGDYDNDGDLDILITGEYSNSLCISKIYNNNNGTFTDINAGLPGVSLGSAAWGDYDNDGDLDILITGLPFPSECISKIYNNNNGTFTDINAGLTGLIFSSAAWGDYDNDGDLDILITGDNVTTISKIYNNNNGTFTDINAGLTGSSAGSSAWGDYDNDGDLDILITGKHSNPLSIIYRNNIGTSNTSPVNPGNLIASVSGSDVIFNWDAATDNETPQDGLSYNLRIGTSPGASDILGPIADESNGYRRIVQIGNAQQNTSWTIDDLPDGTYNWSVQAIDHAFAGSAFASESSFTITPHFIVGTGDMFETRWELYISEATLPNGDSLDIGDEIAIYDGATIVGALVLTVKPAGTNWSSSRLDAFTVFTTGEPGYTPGNPTMKAWDASASLEYYVTGTPFTVDNTVPTNWADTLFPNVWAYTGIKLEFDKISPGTTTVSGTVTSDEGAHPPIEGATVTIDYTGYNGTTIADGTYSISNVPAGTFDVTALATGYITKTKLGETFSPPTETINFVLDTFNQHYTVNGNPADSIWTLYIQQATINGTNMTAQDEIAIYDGATLVGQFTLTQLCTENNRLENDLIAFATLNGGNGWDAGNSYTFEAWDISGSALYTYSTATLVAGSGAYTGNTYPESFDAFSFLSIDFITEPGWIEGTINVNGATVTATNTSTSAIYTDTSAAGSYTITDLPVGTYDITAKKLAYYSVSSILPFTVNTGAATTIHIWLAALPTNIAQTISLIDGYQFVSRNIEPANIDMGPAAGGIVVPIHGSLTSIKNAAAATYVNPGGAGWVNNIGDWNKEEGYLFYMSGATTLTITGYIIDQTLVPIYLSAGHYQFISYLPIFTMDAQIAYTDILDNLEWAKNTSGATLRKIGGVWVNNIGNVGPNEGIQLKMTGADTLIYRATAPPGPMNVVQNLELQHFIFEGGNAADNTYTIYIETDDFEIGDEIAALDGDKLVGAMVIESTDPWYNDLNSFMTLNSGPGYIPDNPIILKGWDASEYKEYSINFEFNDPYGGAYMNTIYPGDNNRYSLAFIEKIATGIPELISNSVKVYPNPATGLVNIYSPVKIQEVEIYNLIGNKVHSSVFDNEFIRISTENLSHGVYIIRLKYGQNIINKKLTIQ